MVLVSGGHLNSENTDTTHPRITSIEITSQALSLGHSGFHAMVLRSFDISSQHRGDLYYVDRYKSAENDLRGIISEASTSQSASDHVALRTKSGCLVGGGETRCSSNNLCHDGSDGG